VGLMIKLINKQMNGKVQTVSIYFFRGL